MSNEKLFSIKCKHCGASVGYDIPSQTYRCTHCGQITQTKDARIAWSIPELSEEQDTLIHSDDMICPSCGATAHFHEESGAYRCDFCDSEFSPSEVRALEWRKLNSHNWDKVQHEELVAECTSWWSKSPFSKRGCQRDLSISVEVIWCRVPCMRKMNFRSLSFPSC